MLKVSRILHAGYLIESSQAKIIFDPIFESPFSVNCYAFPAVSFDLEQLRQEKFDAVFISHFHDDHFSMESLKLIERSTPIFMFTVFAELLGLLKQLGFKQVQALTLDQGVEVKDIKVIPRRALDEDVDSIFQIESEGFKILNVVDSWIDESTLEVLRQQGPWDLVMWPFQTMRELEMIAPTRHPSAEPEIPSEWIEQLRTLSPKALIPSSCQFKMEPWSWYNKLFFPISYQMFMQEMSQVLPASHIFRLNPGESVILKSDKPVFTERLSWVVPQEDPEADYVFDLQTKIPDMSEVGSHFPVTSSEVQDVVHFCEKDLTKRFNQLPTEVHDYFEKSGCWNLILFAPEKTWIFTYEFIEGKATWVSRSDKPLLWKTEIPLKKLFGALQQGESLSSLYIRINAVTLQYDFEKSLADVEVTEDPLLRVLYNQSLGSYQKAQLRIMEHHGSGYSC